MEKKVFKLTQNVFVQKNIFEKLNEKIEQLCLNSKVMFFVEPHLFLKYKKEIFELKKYSLNFISIIVLENFGEEMQRKILEKIDESVSLILALGGKNCFNFIKRITIKSNINSIFLSEDIATSSVFSPFCYTKNGNELIWRPSLPATYIVIKEPYKKNKFQMYSYFANLLFYELENFLSSIFLKDKKINFYYDKNNSIINNIIVNELNFQKNSVNNNLLDEILFYSKQKNCCETKIILSLILLNLYRSFIAQLTFNNYGFKKYIDDICLLENYSNKTINCYLNYKLPVEKIGYQIFTARKILLKKLDNCIERIRLYCDFMKLLEGSNFENMSKNININAILKGIKLTAKITKNKTFLKVIDEFNLLI